MIDLYVMSCFTTTTKSYIRKKAWCSNFDSIGHENFRSTRQIKYYLIIHFLN